MKLSMGMGQGLEMRQSQKLDLEQSLEQRQSLRLAFTQRLEELFHFGGDAPEKLIDDVLGRAFAGLPAPSRKIFQETLGAFPTIGQEMTKHANLLALTNANRLSEFAVTVFYTMQNGEFFEDDAEKNDRRVSLNDLVKTLHDPTWAVRERDQTKRLMATQANAGSGLADTFARLQKSIQLAELLKPSIEQLVGFVRAVLAAKDPQTGETIQAYVREQAILEKFFPLASERVERRLVESLKRIGPRDSSERFEHATLNAVGESLLVGLGVISPELFELQHFSDDDREEAEMKFAELGFDVQALRRLFGEKKESGVFWHRWKTTTVKPGALTDVAIRDFITEHLRKDRDEILTACEYQEFFDRAQELAIERRSAHNIEDRDIALNSLQSHVAEMLGSEPLHECLKKLAAESWYRDLDKFFQKR